ncbi:hypothetical protein P7K49_032381 [Saguinus oedipus]|uniref:Uncharacterized protein n=1 Tax=Saguinus oedipus TaxID=9490 RepID=A0ABQ9TYW9_SAGOE|nr:hypothetical protein P7K49_032381 [Saguinus oedipus]
MPVPHRIGAVLRADLSDPASSLIKRPRGALTAGGGDAHGVAQPRLQFLPLLRSFPALRNVAASQPPVVQGKKGRSKNKPLSLIRFPAVWTSVALREHMSLSLGEKTGETRSEQHTARGERLRTSASKVEQEPVTAVDGAPKTPDCEISDGRGRRPENT